MPVHTRWFNIHFNHRYQITAKVSLALPHLPDASILLGDQGILVGLNDMVEVQCQPMRLSANNQVRPYHLSQ